MTAEEAKKFGLIDSVVEKENKSQYIAYNFNFSLISINFITILLLLIRYV